MLFERLNSLKSSGALQDFDALSFQDLTEHNSVDLHRTRR